MPEKELDFLMFICTLGQYFRVDTEGYIKCSPGQDFSNFQNGFRHVFEKLTFDQYTALVDHLKDKEHGNILPKYGDTIPFTLPWCGKQGETKRSPLKLKQLIEGLHHILA
jgi:hypothetical protein